jgi:ATP-binding protein involved in chromosome partitioning
MGDTELATVQTTLAALPLAPTGRTLGAAGSALTVTAAGDSVHVSVVLGFPGDGIREHLETMIRGSLDSLGVAATVDISWKVEAHVVQQAMKPLPGVSNIVAVASGKGGVGKSTIATNLSVALARQGARVGLLDADIYGPSVPRMLGLAGQRPESPDGKTMLPLKAHGIVAMSVGFLVDERQPMAWRGPMVTSALNQLLTQTEWGELDYLFIDMPPGTGDIQLTLAQRVPVSGAVIVTTPQDIALADARKGLEMFQKVNVPILGVIENMGVHVCSNCGHEESIFGTDGGQRLSDDYDVPLLGSVPLVGGIRELTDAGTPPAMGPAGDPLADRYAALALRTAGQLAASRKDYSRLFPHITVEDD